ncbi:hypothetical protein Patl1_25721 [Pistacia atlantica]|uniref:Uncharacterized protein n=1 Tax=Pistacia atlantica TaxID=434234 RepID=A0ACC1B004_9ROSI|nr:hypothetical protein Patl1_25721 [Pistacia atlantica]
MQFLMGLNETYAQARGQILMMNPLPSVNQAYSMLVTEESQRSIVFPRIHCLILIIIITAAVQREKNWNVIYKHCNVRGHKKENCYRIIGYPPNFKFTKKKFAGTQSLVNHVSAPSTDHAEPNNSGPTVAPVFFKEQYAEILKLLNKDSTTSTSDGMVNMAGIKCFISSLGEKQF